MDGNDYIGREIGNYRITSEINSGAFGSVYKAEHAYLKERIVAIKLLHTYLGSAQERDQFVQEAQFLERLEHPHILTLLDFGFSKSQPYLIAGYAAGGSLRDLLKLQAPLPLDKALAILTQVGQALHYAHQQQIIHRDLKPENILFNAQREVLLADFGIATMLSTASVKHLTTITGTPPYMAPEQFQGITSKEGDQYALGCIAYELVTGHQPFTAPDFLSMGFKHLTEQPVSPIHYNPQIPVATEAVILKALAKQRSDRHADISAFLAALRSSFTQQAKTQWLSAGDKHYHAERYTEALAAYEQAIYLDPNYASAYNNKGATLHELIRYEEALRAYEQAIHLNPQLAATYHNKGATLHELTRYEEALRAYEQAIHLNPYYADAYYDKGATLRELIRYEEALTAYEQAIHLNPYYADAYLGKGAVLEQLGRLTEAQQAYEKVWQLKSNP